jgi:hypothetical protein
VFWINLPVGLAGVLLAARVVPESKDEHVRGRPDLIGAGLLAAAAGLVALALVDAPGWGWGSARFTGLLVASLACGAALVARSRRHHSPVIELGLLRSRAFSGTFAASVLYYAAFGAFVLNSVEFLTGVRTTPRCGPGSPSAQARSWSCRSPGWPPPRLAAWVGGPGRFGTGSGILNMARQVGTVLGVAGLVAILADVVPGDPVATYRQGPLLIAGFFAAAGAVSAALLTARVGRTQMLVR